MVKLHVFFLLSCLFLELTKVFFFIFFPTIVLEITHFISLLSVGIQDILICIFNLTKCKVNPVFTFLPDKNGLCNTVSGQLLLT